MTLQLFIDRYNDIDKRVHDFELDNYAKMQSSEGNKVFVHGLRVRDSRGCTIREKRQLDNGMIVLVNNEHQYRTRKETKDRLVRTLDITRLQIAPSMSFEQLYDEVERALGRMTDLLHYDITLRIGAANGIRPKDFVYLHAGALKGAKALIGQHKVETPKVKLSDFVSVMRDLQGFTAYDVEHFLCVFHKKL